MKLIWGQLCHASLGYSIAIGKYLTQYCKGYKPRFPVNTMKAVSSFAIDIDKYSNTGVVGVYLNPSLKWLHFTCGLMKSRPGSTK